MIHILGVSQCTMSLRVFICLIFCVGESTDSIEKLFQIAPGSDVSLSCLCNSGQSCWEGPQFSNSVRVNLNKTEYLLIKDFQVQNKGRYHCKPTPHTYNLDLKYASSNDQSVLFRASEGDSLFLFCEELIASPLKATWYWRSHRSYQDTPLELDTAHFGNRLRFRNKSNDFSLNISNIQWDDSGRYECRRLKDSSKVKTSFELVVVRVHTDPEQLTEGDSVTLQCEVSHHLPDTRLYWINMEAQESFPNPHELRNVRTSQRSWRCAVFTGSTLKALVPLTLNITQRFITTTITTASSTPTPRYHSTDKSTTQIQTTTHSRWTTQGTDSQGTSHPRGTTIFITTGFSFILVVVLGAVCWRRRTKKNPEPERSTRVHDSITYAAVSFKQKSEKTEEVEEEHSTCARDSVTYAEVSFRQKSDDVSSESESISNDEPADAEVLYSSVNLCKNVN